MKKIKFKIKLGVDIAMIVVFLVNMFTGFAMFFGLVAGGGRMYGGAGGFNVLNITDLSAKAWCRFIHDWSGIIMVVLILFHLILNWNTLCCYLRNSFKKNKNKKEEISCEII
jgi:cytochrome b subunit of formate dehydrogenase